MKTFTLTDQDVRLLFDLLCTFEEFYNNRGNSVDADTAYDIRLFRKRLENQQS